MFPEPIKEADLAVAAALYPPVECVCGMCNGEKSIPDPTYELGNSTSRIPCPTCEGSGFYLREMDAREEHFYIMHLLTTRFQLR